MAVGEQDLFTFLSDTGLLYRVESSPDPMSQPWTPVGLTVEGDGTQKYAYDPTGTVSTAATYRVRIVP